MNIAILILDNMVETSVFLSLNSFQYIKEIEPTAEIKVETIGLQRLVRLSTGQSVEVDRIINKGQLKWDVVIIPGLFYYKKGKIISFLESKEMKQVSSFLLSRTHKKTIFAASCFGTFLLAETGLLDRKKATSVWWQQQLFQARYPKVKLMIDQLVVRDNNILTAGPAFAHADLMTSLIELIFSRATSSVFKKCTSSVDRKGQAAQFDYHLMAANDKQMTKLVSLIFSQLSSAVSVEYLANELAVSARTLNRKTQLTFGCSPQKLITQIKCQRARVLLEKRELSIEEVSEQVGYLDVRLFRRAFKHLYKVSPLHFRNQLRT